MALAASRWFSSTFPVLPGSVAVLLCSRLLDGFGQPQRWLCQLSSERDVHFWRSRGPKSSSSLQKLNFFSRAGFVSLVSCRCWCCGPVLGAGVRQGHRWIWVALLAVLGGGWRQVALLACSYRQLMFKVIRISGQVSTKLRAEEEPGGSPSPSEGSATIKHWLWTLFLCPAYRIRGVLLLELRLSKLA